MNFQEVRLGLVEGKRYRRGTWALGMYIEGDANGTIGLHLSSESFPNWSADAIDLSASDWSEYFPVEGEEGI